jgi:uncharacterized protein
MNCPVCNISLVMSERQGVEIDYCPQCRGVWLDRGELDKIMERTAAETVTKAPPVYEGRYERPVGEYRDKHYDKHHDDHHDDDYRHHKKRSFLHDLFD